MRPERRPACPSLRSPTTPAAVLQNQQKNEDNTFLSRPVLLVPLLAKLSPPAAAPPSDQIVCFSPSASVSLRAHGRGGRMRTMGGDLRDDNNSLSTADGGQVGSSVETEASGTLIFIAALHRCFAGEQRMMGRHVSHPLQQLKDHPAAPPTAGGCALWSQLQKQHRVCLSLPKKL